MLIRESIPSVLQTIRQKNLDSAPYVSNLATALLTLVDDHLNGKDTTGGGIRAVKQ